MNDKINRLLSRCSEARAAGLDFPTIWNDVLRRDPLTLGTPVQGHDGQTTTLSIRLMGDTVLMFDGDVFSLHRM